MPELYEHVCQFPGCTKITFGYYAVCRWCFEARCSEHNRTKYHHCTSLGKIKNHSEKIKLKLEVLGASRRRVFTDVLDLMRESIEWFRVELKALRPRHECTITLPEDVDAFMDATKNSGFNYHFRITFDDGVEWFLRVRQNRGPRPPREIAHAVVSSEVTTLNELHERGIPVPKAFLPPDADSVPSSHITAPPLDYFYYERIEGKPYDVQRKHHHWGLFDLSDQQLDHFIEQFARVQIRLSDLRLPFKKIGCLIPSSSDPGKVEVGPIVTRGCFMNRKSPYFLGPFTTNKERYLAHIDAALRYIFYDALQKGRPVDEYLWHLELRELVMASKELDEDLDQVYIKHDDEKGDHLMVDHENNVVGILDWEWAYVTTKAEAFSTPWLFNRTPEYVFLGSNALTPEEVKLCECYEQLGRPDLAQCVRKGRLYTRLNRIGGYDPAYSKSGFREVFGQDIPSDFKPPYEDVDWRVYMMKRYKDIKGLRKMMDKYGWTIERAEAEAVKWHKERKEQLQGNRVAGKQVVGQEQVVQSKGLESVTDTRVGSATRSLQAESSEDQQLPRAGK
ncbi:hypothetical protein IAU59_004104 [Kwoniella sp. CBS 9459]